MTWNEVLIDGKLSLYKELTQRISALEKIHKFNSFKFAKNLANAIFTNKLHYGAELWGGVPNYIKKRIQSLQLEMACTVIGQHSKRWSKHKLLAKMEWMDVEKTLGFVSNKLTYSILYNQQPQLLHHRLTCDRNVNPIYTRLLDPYKLGPHPWNVGRTKLTRQQYRAQTYNFYSTLPEAIQTLSNFKHFTKWMKSFTNSMQSPPMTNSPPSLTQTLPTHPPIQPKKNNHNQVYNQVQYHIY